MPNITLKPQKPPCTVEQAARHLCAAYAQLAEAMMRITGVTSIRVDSNEPTTLEGIKAAAAHGYVHVGNQNINPVFGHCGTIACRVMHDLGHVWLGFDLTHKDEPPLIRLQWEALRSEYMQHLTFDEIDFCKAVYMADMLEATLHDEKHGHFPTDPKAFLYEKLREAGWDV